MVALSTAAHPSPFDPLDRMAPDEPRFVIRGSDPAGPGAITEWSRIRRNWAIKLFGLEKGGEAERLLRAELAQCNEADTLALEWKERQQQAEPTEGERARYNEVTLTEDQVAAAKRQKNVAELIRHLREAAFYACEIIEADGPTVEPWLAELHVQINEGANLVEYGPATAEAA